MCLRDVATVVCLKDDMADPLSQVADCSFLAELVNVNLLRVAEAPGVAALAGAIRIAAAVAPTLATR